MKQFTIPAAYRLVQRSSIPELSMDGYRLEHIRSGATLILMPCEDENKTFFISFRTPPADSTGVPHILEHSVLCGSEKYPVKDPFVELMKSSLNTFMNAFTFPDKTMYPVSSCNDRDFANLMDVYMDAVLHPLVYSKEEIFRQEGWRYEWQDGKLNLNGVVYNEMKGVYSSPDSILNDESVQALFPDTAYGVNSGGDPAVIPTLTYEAFCDFHRKYYHPSNSCIFLYGNMDMSERLQWLDEAYLSHYEVSAVDSALRMQQPFAELKKLHRNYPVGPEEETKGGSFLARSWAVGSILDSRTVKALEILDQVILQAPGAPLKQALLDAGVCEDVSGGLETEMLQPVYSVVGRDTDPEQADAFLRTVDETLAKLADEGLSGQSLLAAINSSELRTREADFGGYPRGLIYGMSVMESLLYDGEDPFAALRFEADYAFLREAIGTGYYEGLIRRFLLQNNHSVFMVLEPQRGLAEAAEAALKAKLAVYRDQMDSAALEALKRSAAALKRYQEEPDSPDTLAKMPRLGRDDLNPAARALHVSETVTDGCRFLEEALPTVGIGYVNFFFGLQGIGREELPWLGVLRSLLGSVDTASYGYRDLYDAVLTCSGGMSFNTDWLSGKCEGSWTPYMTVNVKAMYGRMDEALRLLGEILQKSVFTDARHIRETLAETLSSLRQSLVENGHQTAVLRASSQCFGGSLFDELTSGISFYRFLKELLEHFDERKEELDAQMKALTERIFTRGRLYAALCAEEKALPQLRETVSGFASQLPYREKERQILQPVRTGAEGFSIAGGISFAAIAGSYRKAGPYTGALRVLQSWLRSDYLWQNLRVLGGAYGAMCRFPRTAPAYFVSYRDPHQKETLDVYSRIPEALASLELTEQQLLGFIIATIGAMDTPLSPASRSDVDFRCFLSGIDSQALQEERDQVLGCTSDTLRGLSAYVRAIWEDAAVCIVGSGSRLAENQDMTQAPLL